MKLRADAMIKVGKVNVLFVCMGNICRSPTAEAVFRRRVEEANLMRYFIIDSAGTHDYHVGAAPDARAQHAAKLRGYDMNQLRGRQVEVADFARFNYVLAMDNLNLVTLERLRPPDVQGHLGLFLDYAEKHNEWEIPDPYQGGAEGFERVLDMVEDAASGLLKHIRHMHLTGK
jgi:protein-tyrosine phosphatase